MTDPLRAGLAACGVAPGDRLLVAASGGVDSTVLLRLLVEIGHPVVAAHVDHGLRPDSGADGGFVSDLAEALGVRSVRVTVEVGEGNVQAEARRARYTALADVAVSEGCRSVATGHTATDQAETVLLALTRGAGLRGLGGMAPRRTLAAGVVLVRPLLDVARHDVEALARGRGWTWREDPSNETGRYRRNRLRHTVLPALRAEGGRGVDRRVAAAAEAARAALDLAADRLDDVGEGWVPLATFDGLGPGARRLLLAEAVVQIAPDALRSRPLVDRLMGLVDAEVGRRVESGGVCAWRERDGIRLETGGHDGVEGWLEVTPLPSVPDAVDPDPDPLSEVVDADRAGGALVVRPWRAGDRIRPLGLDGTMRVSDLLQSRGVPRAVRGRVPVVERGGDVVWVVGHRLGAAVALTESTRRAARWTWRAGGGAG